jgi:energy-coupling factor transport system ATP-binding protein
MDWGRKEELAAWIAEMAQRGASVVVATHDVEFASAFADRVVLLGDGELIADGPVAEILSGGWYFATEVARILGTGAAISPDQGAATLRAMARARDEVPVATEVPAGSGPGPSPVAAQPEASRRRSGA